MYIDYSRIFSYNALLNFIIASRGTGKTFGITDFVVDKFLKRSDEFVYVRRYKSELQKSIPKFFNALLNEEKTKQKYKDHEFTHKGMNLMIDDKTCGYGITLSTAQQFKSSNFPKVKYIIFDEFILEDGQGHYLKNEVDIFLGLIESVARLRDIKVILLGNSANIMNPYFLFFNLHLPYNNEIITFKDGMIALQYATSEEYKKVKKESKFGKLVAGTSYEDYAINNNFINDNRDFVEKKDKDSKFSFSFVYNDVRLGVWINWLTGKMYVSNDYLENGIIFACTSKDHKPNTMLMSIAKKYNCWNNFINNFKLGNLYYENTKIKNIAFEVMKMIVKY